MSVIWSEKVPSLSIRPADANDLGLILHFVKELASYEKLSADMVATEDDYRTALFGEHPRAEVVIASYGGEPAGFALFFHNFSTFVGKPGLYLEDLFVSPHLRGKGIGKALLIYLARIAVDRGCGRFEWSVLDWNKPAIEFYKSLGAVAMDDWTIYRESASALKKLSAQTL